MLMVQYLQLQSQIIICLRYYFIVQILGVLFLNHKIINLKQFGIENFHCFLNILMQIALK